MEIQRTPTNAIKTATKIFPAIIAIFVSVLGILTTSQKIFHKEDLNDVSAQIEKLDMMSDNLSDFQFFLEQQKENLKSEQTVLTQLKEEKKNLEPLVQADREIVEAVFKQQEKRQREKVWYERAFGFFIGVLSSLLATFIYVKFIKTE